MRRLLVLMGVVTALIAFAPATAIAQDEAPATVPAQTDIRYFLPFGPDGLNASLTVAGTEPGVCAFQSLATTGRPDAWECIGDSNQLYDPCFENPFAPLEEPGELACIASPFVDAVVMVAVDEPLPREKESAPADPGLPDAWDLPWALELANGDRCVLLPTIEAVIAGEAVHYLCEDGGTILGEVNRGQAVWSVHYLADGQTATNLVGVTAVWN